MTPVYYDFTLRRLTQLMVILTVMLIAGCKKEYTNTTTTPPPAVKNTAPTAHAGANIHIILPTDSCILLGTGNDEESNISSYTWKNISGPTGSAIVSPNSLQTKVRNLKVGEYNFEFTVIDAEGLKSSDTVSVYVLQPGPNEIIFKDLEWYCPMGCYVEVNNLNSFLPQGAPFLAYIRLSTSSQWQLALPENQQNGTVRYTYYLYDNRNRFVILSGDETGKADVKIQY